MASTPQGSGPGGGGIFGRRFASMDPERQREVDPVSGRPPSEQGPAEEAAEVHGQRGGAAATRQRARRRKPAAGGKPDAGR